jgi:hypothetical protein
MVSNMVSLARIKEEMKSLKHMQGKRLKAAKEKYSRPFKVAGDALVLNGAAFAAGVIQGRTDGYKLGGAVPIEVLLGAGFHVAGLFDAGGDGVAHQMHNLGNGFLAAWASSVGWNVGRKWKGGKNPGGLKGIEDGIRELLSGDDGPSGGGAASPEDIIKLARGL